MLATRVPHWGARLRVACGITAWAALAFAYLLPNGIAALDALSARMAELDVAPIVACTGWLVSRLMTNASEARWLRVTGSVLCFTALLAWALIYAAIAVMKIGMLL